MKRILSIIMIAVILVSTVFTSGADYAGFESERLMAYAEDVAAAVSEYETTYKFGDDDTLTADDVSAIMTMVFNENPQFFCLNKQFSFTYTRDPVTGSSIVKSLIFQYSMTEEEYAYALSEVNTWVENVKSLGSSEFTEYEWALFFHDYLCANYEYDVSMDSRTVYSFIKTGKGVCQAYTYAYMLLLESVGISTSWASSAEMDHVWNLVQLDGEWYHVDVTWDDPVGNAPGMAKHGFFLLSDEAISTEQKGHFAWVSSYACTSDKYDANKSAAADSAYGYLGGKWYYVSGGDLFVTYSPEAEGKLFMELDLIWFLWDNPNTYYTNSYSAVLSYNGKLYVSTPDSILKIDTESGRKKTAYRYSGNEGRVYGFMIDMGEDGVSGAGLAGAEVLVNIAKKYNETELYENAKLTFVMTGGSGDANGDGKVNLSDASLMLKFIAKWDVELDESASDTNNDDIVSITDVSNVLRFIAAG